MMIHIYNLAERKIIFALPFISGLAEKFQSVTVYTGKETICGLDPLFSSSSIPVKPLPEKIAEKNPAFPDIDLEPAASILIISEMGQLPAKIRPDLFVFPIINRSESAQYNSLRNKYPNNFAELEGKALFHSIIPGQHEDSYFLLQKILTEQDLKGYNILISAGPTAEDIDPVRYLTNRSTGKMGLEIAIAAFLRGATIQFVLGPGRVKPPGYINTSYVRSAKQMAEEVVTRFHHCDAYIATAAVADYTSQACSTDKIKKIKDDLVLNFKPTTDILKALNKLRKNQRMVGFSVETQSEKENSLRKLIEKDLDFIVLNNPKEKGAGFAGDTNRVSLLFKDGREENLPLISKFNVGQHILDHLKVLLEK